jgi:hypothetical protein
MTEHELENILGPPRSEVRAVDPAWALQFEINSHRFWLPSAEWRGRRGVICVWYGSGQVVEKNFSDHRYEVRPLSLVEKFEERFRKP